MAFTIRPTEEFEQKITQLKEHLDEKTATSVINFVVNNYADKVNQLAATQKRLVETELELKRITMLLKKKSAVENDIEAFLDKYTNPKKGDSHLFEENQLSLPFGQQAT